MRHLALACVATVAVADYVIHRRDLSWFQTGPLDHAAHLATTALLIPPGKSRPWVTSFLVGSVLPDLDHVPLAVQGPEVGDPRPRSHSLLSLAPAALGSPATALGMLTHYARDAALEPGLPLLWPLTGRHVRVPYGVYAAAIIVLAASRAAPGSKAPAGAT